MDEFVLWTWVVGGTPLALALIRRAAEWSLDVARAAVTARGPAVGGRLRSGGSLPWWNT
jgi:hypothetical protein